MPNLSQPNQGTRPPESPCTTLLQHLPIARLSSLIIRVCCILVLQSATITQNKCRTASSSGTTRPATRGGSSPARTSPCPTSTSCATRTPTSTSLKEERRTRSQSSTSSSPDQGIIIRSNKRMPLHSTSCHLNA